MRNETKHNIEVYSCMKKLNSSMPVVESQDDDQMTMRKTTEYLHNDCTLLLPEMMKVTITFSFEVDFSGTAY